MTIERRLPRPGTIRVRAGQRVESFDVIGQATAPDEWAVVDVMQALALRDSDLSQVMLVKEGETVEKGQVIARAGSGLLGKRQCRAPAGGTVAAIGPGWVVLVTRFHVAEVEALVSARVSRTIPGQAAILEARGAHLEGACALGGERSGVLQRATEDPAEVLEAKHISVGMHNSILIGGRTVTAEALYRAAEMRVSGVVVGSFDAALLALDPAPALAVLATEGFGSMPMSGPIYDFLTGLAGHEAAICRAPGGGNWPGRPLIFVPTDEESAIPLPSPTPATAGNRVRALRAPYLAEEGTIVSIPTTPQAAGFGLPRWGAEIDLAGGTRFVPWLNLEQII